MDMSTPNVIELYAPTDQPLQKPWNHWCAKWWEWLYSIPSPYSPIYGSDRKDGNKIIPDPAFNLTLRNQGKDGVIFLAGARSGTVERTCTIAQDKAIFFPIATCECSFAEFPNFSMGDLVNNAEQGNKVRDMSVEIRGLEVLVLDNNTRKDLQMNDLKRFSFSGEFQIEQIPYDNIFGADNRTPSSAYYVGYWLCLKPINRMTDFHLIVSQDTEDNLSTNTFNSSYTITYHLVIQ